MKLLPPLGLDLQIWALLLGCLLSGYCLQLLLSRIRWRRHRGDAVRAYLTPFRPPEKGAGAAARKLLQVDPDYVILSSLHITSPRVQLQHLRVLGGLVPVLGLLAARFPLLPSLVVGVLGFVVMDAWLKGRWQKFRASVEAELPTFVSRLGAMLLLNESLTACLDEVLETLPPESSPLRVWMDGYLQGIRQEGKDFLDHAREQANRISPSLALVVFQLGRVVETGGVGFAHAFASSAEEMQTILEVRAVAAAKAEGARNSIAILLAIMGVVIALMAASPGMREGFLDVTAQTILMAALGTMAFGYYFLTGMIADALE